MAENNGRFVAFGSWAKILSFFTCTPSLLAHGGSRGRRDRLDCTRALALCRRCHGAYRRPFLAEHQVEGLLLVHHLQTQLLVKRRRFPAESQLIIQKYNSNGYRTRAARIAWQPGPQGLQYEPRPVPARVGHEASAQPSSTRPQKWLAVWVQIDRR